MDETPDIVDQQVVTLRQRKNDCPPERDTMDRWQIQKSFVAGPDSI